jgi:RimJ/RimL family protein N-acetyltransferase
MEFRPPLTLEGRYVALVPVTLEQAEALAAVGQDPEIWRYKSQGFAGTPTTMRARLTRSLAAQAEGRELPFTILRKPEGAPVGQTAFREIQRRDRTTWIGDTWVAPSAQRTEVNTEAKYLLLRHAFETEGCQRVQFITDTRNLRSQQALERLGAVRELVLRHHLVMPDGYVRDSVVYRILDDEWPSVRARLEGFLQRGHKEVTG